MALSEARFGSPPKGREGVPLLLISRLKMVSSQDNLGSVSQRERAGCVGLRGKPFILGRRLEKEQGCPELL